MEIRNADLARWRDDYVANMARATAVKGAHQATALAKQNAQFWVFGAGLGGLGRILGPEQAPEALRMLVGRNLLGTLLGDGENREQQKRNREDEETDEQSERRVRPRLDDEVGRGENNANVDADGDVIMNEGDDFGPAFDDVSFLRFAWITFNHFHHRR